MEKILAVLNCIEEQKVLFATFELVEEVEWWWHVLNLIVEQRAVPIVMTWGHFKQVFYDRYFLAMTRNAKAEEFFSFQGRLIIQHYAAKFLKLSHFAPSIVRNEYQKARWFERGLNQRIHEHMACLQIQDFMELVKKATVAESSLQRRMEASK
ncbi:uncharacterized protein LOC131145819 [Malania oleifera]|uniref:uncharacterized protein LOC131145819 n=1 Tax=Malania oleifera TaxID=397392 RepID=UPI0025AEA8E8|nr:uncharacterized protein LOC131145819 [Malania oleifera]